MSAKIRVNTVKFFETINGFGYKKWDLHHEYFISRIKAIMMKLMPIIKDLENHPDRSSFKIKIIGHADGLGPEEPDEALGKPGNIAISKSRAQSVLDYIIKNYDVPADLFVAIGKGSSEIKNKTYMADPENRRVEIIFEP